MQEKERMKQNETAAKEIFQRNEGTKEATGYRQFTDGRWTESTCEPHWSINKRENQKQIFFFRDTDQSPLLLLCICSL